MLPPVVFMMVDETDREFMTELFLRYKRIMFSEISKIVPDQWEAEDILQNALIKLSEKVSLLRGLDERRRVSYVITTVRNLAKNSLRDKHGLTVYSLDDENLRLADSISEGTDIEQSVIFKEQLEDLSLVWDMLDDTSKCVLEGKYILKKSDAELGKMLGISPASVRMMLTRSRRKVLELLKTKS